jgi:DNA processing protein
MAREPRDVPDATLRLLLATGLGPATLARARAAIGSDAAVAAAGEDQLARLEGIGRATAVALRAALDAADPDAEREAMAARGVRLILRGDDDYPVLLEPIPEAPAALWVRGRLSDADRLAVAVVGSRRCTAYGREQAGRLAALLAECGLTVVSGGAAGIDGAAHRGALRAGGRTIAVMGCGLAGCYPPQHADLFERIVRSGGALVSDYPMRTEPRPGHFPQRNRIISGLSLGVLVVEAARRSGALITARRAAEEQGREVMAVPGRVDSPASAGCLQAIRDGWAALVTSHADVLGQLDSASHLVRGALEAAGHAGAAKAGTLFDGNLTDGQRAIVSALEANDGPLGVDQISARTQLLLSRILADLTLMQIRGLVRKEGEGFRLLRR